MKCCICHREIVGHGNNPDPFFADDKDARCCDDCDSEFVLPVRIAALRVTEATDAMIKELIDIVEALAQEGVLDEYYSEKSE